MDDIVADRPIRPVAIVRHPITSMLLPVPVVCFVGVLLTDLAYLGSGGNLVWLDFTSWLLLAGLVFGGVAAIFLLTDAVRGAAAWLPFGLLLAAWLVELVSMFIHNRDGWTAVAGLGLVLSIIGAVLILIAAWLRRPAVEVVQ
ncbi:MAG: DUF2231 domain-containing protein [Sphingomicrobium sp.]